jgi:AcrR family transcriptional regulator
MSSLENAADPNRAARTGVQAEVYELKRERILEAASELFAERGYNGTSMTAIADALGATKPFVYYHFKDKHEILRETCRRGVVRALAALDEVLKGGGNCREQLNLACHALAAVSLERRAYVTVYSREMDRLSDEARADLAALRRRFDRRLGELIAEGCRRGEFEVDEPRVTAACMSTMIIYTYGWFRDDGALSADEVANHLALLARRMVNAR